MPDGVQGSSATTTNVSVPGSYTGEAIDTSGDHDWYRVFLTAGQTYSFTTSAPQSGSGVDTILTLRDANGNQIASNDDIAYPGNTYSQIRFTATTSGGYYLDVGAYSTGTGGYTLTTALAEALPIFTNDQISDQLTSGYWGGSTRRWNVAPGGTITVNLTGLTTEGQFLAREALNLWTDVSCHRVVFWSLWQYAVGGRAFADLRPMEGRARPHYRDARKQEESADREMPVHGWPGHEHGAPLPTLPPVLGASPVPPSLVTSGSEGAELSGLDMARICTCSPSAALAPAMTSVTLNSPPPASVAPLPSPLALPAPTATEETSPFNPRTSAVRAAATASGALHMPWPARLNPQPAPQQPQRVRPKPVVQRRTRAAAPPKRSGRSSASSVESSVADDDDDAASSVSDSLSDEKDDDDDNDSVEAQQLEVAALANAGNRSEKRRETRLAQEAEQRADAERLHHEAIGKALWNPENGIAFNAFLDTAADGNGKLVAPGADQVDARRDIVAQLEKEAMEKQMAEKASNDLTALGLLPLASTTTTFDGL